MTVNAVACYPTNAELIAAVAQLGYLRPEWCTIDATYGRGVFWRAFRPQRLVTVDLAKGEPMLRGDFRRLPFGDRAFDAAVLDGPYKLNGTSSSSDERYGVEVYAGWRDRHRLIGGGIVECARVTSRVLLVKCQDQVCGGRVRWQTREFADRAEACGFELVDVLHRVGGRVQPGGRRQLHARRNLSSLLVLERRGDG